MYCSQCGNEVTKQVVDGRRRPICLACGHVAYERLRVGAGVLVERDGALLLLQRSEQSEAFPSAWNLPAGYCEVDEPPQAAAAREAAEETGLRIQVGALIDVYFFNDDLRGNGLLLVYEGKLAEDGPVLGVWRPENAEVSAARFFLPDCLPSPLCGGGHDRAIESWRRRALDRWAPGMPMRHCPQCTHPLEEKLAFDRLRMVCPACGFIHFREPKVGVSVLIEREGQVLLVQRAIDPGRGAWCLPSGFVDWDEAPEAAALRECREETGLSVTHFELFDARQYTDDFRGPGINLSYRARVAGGTLQAGDDALVARWFAADDLPPHEEIAFRSHSSILEIWRSSVPS